ncbi:MAG: sn-glycerol-3-phosphate transport system permease protein UgpE [Candidatus Roseilinea sp.]|nr:MAG: sn-glycerol-3-phosphate transport system permease protein UgpE [Candidatus Roseilinea sp.]
MAISQPFPAATPASRADRRRKPLRPSRVVLYAVVLFFAALFGFPLLWTLMASLKTVQETFAYPPVFFPAVPQFGNYIRVLSVERIPVLLWTWNAAYITALTTLGTVITASLVGYSFARFSYRGRDALFLITLATLTLPAQVTLIPQFVLFHRLGWINTHLPLWVPAWFGGGAFGIFLMRQFFLTIPRDLDEAALIDGASYPRIFWSVLLPLLKPPIVTLAIITALATWSDYQSPIIYLNSPDKFTISVGLHFFVQSPEVGGEPLQHLLMAACVLAMIPAVIIFFAGQRYFVQGVVMSGLKG